jgi:hypothetical protein
MEGVISPFRAQSTILGGLAVGRAALTKGARARLAVHPEGLSIVPFPSTSTAAAMKGRSRGASIALPYLYGFFFHENGSARSKKTPCFIQVLKVQALPQVLDPYVWPVRGNDPSIGLVSYSC